MDRLILECLLAEIGPRLAGARIEKAYQYGPYDLALRLWLRPASLRACHSADSLSAGCGRRRQAPARLSPV